MNKIFYCFAGTVFGAATMLAVLLYNEKIISTQAIDADIIAFEKKVEDVTTLGNKYSGGLIKNMLLVQAENYKNVISFLELKRASLIHRVNIDYNILYSSNPIANNVSVDIVDDNINSIKKKIESAKKESALYSGGLIKSLIDVRIQQDELSIASLEHIKMSLIYGIPILFSYISADSIKKDVKPENMNLSQEDDKAL